MPDYYKITKQNFIALLKNLLDKKMVDKVISGISKRSPFSITPNLVSEADQLDNFPIDQLFIHNFDRINSASKFLHKQGGALNEKIAMIGHPCDGRAIVELSKIMQVNPDNIFRIIMEDYGVIQARALSTYLKKAGINEADIKEEFLTEDKLLLKTKDDAIKELELGKDISIVDNCSRCFRKTAENSYDLAITTITTKPFGNELIVKVGSPKGAEIMETIEKTKLSNEDIKELQKFQNKLKEDAYNKRQKDIQEFLSNDNRIVELSKCTMCGVCISACPVCFCVSCILQNQRKEKSIDKLTYQLTRIAHVGDSCVGCGKCDQNCPTHLPLSLYFQTINDDIVAKFNYTPGMEPDKPRVRSKANVRSIIFHKE
ncbi:MAG: Coenzyme F420 hydrogenase/dehydrogenase, beta subunit C-terminal domain [Promethearchaeota archaeon]